MILFKQHCEEHLKTLTGEFNTLLNSCNEDLTSDNCDAINACIKDITTIQSQNLSERQKRKFRKDGTYIHHSLPFEDDASNSDIIRITRENNKPFDNLTHEERTALKNLRSNNNIVIKAADKGSAVVVMDKYAYIQEVERQLGDTRFYRKLDSDPTTSFSREITDVGRNA
ncbi:uncharacterized protein LOC127719111 [Mytilus californianus]|uniref:uncharacterized protein LOC127719111 n=1 Tax=Mytilus californianus TaxID=6549 RepID=UPI002246A247|nr:uncharacterized protein LOC127719111 [Mytilus californianus]